MMVVSGDAINDLYFLVTHDNGTNWTDLGGNLNLSSPHYLYNLSISGTRLFAGINSGGLWYRDDVVTGDDLLEKKLEDRRVILYPNPAKGSDVTLEVKKKFNQETLLELIDPAGRLDNSWKPDPNTNKFRFETKDMDPGIYLLVVSSDRHGTTVAKLILY